MTPHHRILLVTLDEAGSVATSDYLAHETQLPYHAVCQAMLELSHKKMVTNWRVRHAQNGQLATTYCYRIKPRGREMCVRIRNALAVGEQPP